MKSYDELIAIDDEVRSLDKDTVEERKRLYELMNSLTKSDLGKLKEIRESLVEPESD